MSTFSGKDLPSNVKICKRHYTSARDASNRGFFPVIATDAVSSFDREGHKRSLANMANMMILLNTEEIISLW